MPPRSGLIPHPWPAVSPVHTNDVASRRCDAVTNRERPTSPRVPSGVSNQSSARCSRPGASPATSMRAVRSERTVAQGPRTTRRCRPLPTRATRRPSPDARAHSTADRLVTSPVCTPSVSASPRRSWPGAVRPTARASAGEPTAPRASSPADPASRCRREGPDGAEVMSAAHRDGVSTGPPPGERRPTVEAHLDVADRGRPAPGLRIGPSPAATAGPSRQGARVATPPAAALASNVLRCRTARGRPRWSPAPASERSSARRGGRGSIATP